MKKSEPTKPANSISQLATRIANDWKKPYFGAVPYVRAMQTFNDLAWKPKAPGMYDWMPTMYGLDRADDVVERFLANAGTWRGEEAKAVKAELKQHLAWAKHVLGKK